MKRYVEGNLRIVLVSALLLMLSASASIVALAGTPKYFGYYWADSNLYGRYMDKVVISDSTQLRDYTNLIQIDYSEMNYSSDADFRRAIVDASNLGFKILIGGWLKQEWYDDYATRHSQWNAEFAKVKNYIAGYEDNIRALYLIDEPELSWNYGGAWVSRERQEELVDAARAYFDGINAPKLDMAINYFDPSLNGGSVARNLDLVMCDWYVWDGSGTTKATFDYEIGRRLSSIRSQCPEKPIIILGDSIKWDTKPMPTLEQQQWYFDTACAEANNPAGPVEGLICFMLGNAGAPDKLGAISYPDSLLLQRSAGTKVERASVLRWSDRFHQYGSQAELARSYSGSVLPLLSSYDHGGNGKSVVFGPGAEDAKLALSSVNLPGSVSAYVAHGAGEGNWGFRIGNKAGKSLIFYATGSASLLPNGDFENPESNVRQKFMADNPIDGWTGSQSYLRRTGFDPGDVAQSGSQYIMTEQPSVGDSYFNVSSSPWLTVVPGTTYRLSFWVGCQPGVSAPKARVLFGNIEDIFQTTESWAQRSEVYTATSSSCYLQFRQENRDGLGYAKWDNVSLEPIGNFKIDDSANGVVGYNTNMKQLGAWQKVEAVFDGLGVKVYGDSQLIYSATSGWSGGFTEVGMVDPWNTAGVGYIDDLEVAQAVAPIGDLVANGGCENPASDARAKFMVDNPIDSWTGSSSYLIRTGTYATDVSHSGSQYTVTEQPAAGINSYVRQFVTVVPGQTYRLSFWVGCQPGVAAPKARVLFGNIEDIFQTTENWAQRCYEYTATSDSVTIELRQENSDGLGYAKWDDVTLEAVMPLNGGFENPASDARQKFMADNPVDGWTGSSSYLIKTGYSDSEVSHSGYQYVMTEQPAVGGIAYVRRYATTVPGKTYRLSFWVGCRPDTLAPIARVLFGNPGSGVEDRFQTTTSWAQRVYEYTATGTSFMIELRQENSDGLGYAEWDDVTLQEVISESPPESVTIDGAKSKPEGTPVSVSGTVTAVFGSIFYIESSDRTSGIRVEGASATVGNEASFSGPVRTLDSGERYISTSSVFESTGTPLTPLGVTNKSLGGGDFPGKPGVAGGSGLNNIGLFMRTTGRVTGSGTGWFTLDDGSGVSVKVIGVAPVGTPYLVVTGISSCEKDNPGTVQRVILSTDAQQIAP